MGNGGYLLALIASKTLGSTSVEVVAQFASLGYITHSRRMILPLRVLGSSGTT
ncbi:Uncharacterised protein [Mycobacteroides abscessus]|nr:Uncharacterised protein [Mycobacteroides abscessus]